MLLADYSGRLAAEIDDRRQLMRTLTVFLQSQKDGLAHNEQKLEVRNHSPSSFERLLAVPLHVTVPGTASRPGVSKPWPPGP